MANGDFVIVSRYFWRLSQGDLVVVNHPVYQRIIKRIQYMDSHQRLWLSGNNSASLSSEKMGWVEKSWVEGKVLKAITKKIFP